VLLFRLPNIRSGLGQADVCEDAGDELPRHFLRVDWLVVEGGDDGKDHGPGFGGRAPVGAAL